MLTTATTTDAPLPKVGASDVALAAAETPAISSDSAGPSKSAAGLLDWGNWSLTPGQLALFAGMAAVTLWTYWTTLVRLELRWAAESEHSHGYIVPVISVVLLWLRSEQCDPRKWKGSTWGLALIGLAFAMRLIGERYLILALHPLSLLPCLAGIFLTAGGWGALKWAAPSIVFLVFMIPLPNSVEQLLSVPLKGYSAEIASWILQIVGEPAVTAGNTLKIGDIRLEIVDACSGMNLLMTMSATVVAYVLIVPRPWSHKVLLLASVLPIAVLSNSVRIAATGILMTLTTSEEAHKLAHDWAGYVVQMPLALIMIALFSAYLGRLLGPGNTSPPDPVEK
jgi:exosortase